MFSLARSNQLYVCIGCTLASPSAGSIGAQQAARTGITHLLAAHEIMVQLAAMRMGLLWPNPAT
jgi:hypothetical protein